MYDAIEFAAVVTSAVFGVLLAARKELDLVGVISVSLIVAFGGGTLRDLFLGRRPLFWVANEHYVVVVFAIALIGSFVPHRAAALERFLPIPDAIGLGLFSVVGAAIARETGTSMFLASIFGAMTGTFGGVVGDVICNEIPRLFRPGGPLYATCGFLGAWTYLLLKFSPLPDGVAVAAGVVVTVAVRVAALRWGLALPAASLTPGDVPDQHR